MKITTAMAIAIISAILALTIVTVLRDDNPTLKCPCESEFDTYKNTFYGKI
ncbi:MAG: hypothetical protein GTN99_02750 [Candidatus Dadabacteria bacterium]|nr:hypothetical protein [Candidatus Dadabacteria bacterium]